MDKQVILKVNGQDISLNPFVERVFSHVANGLVASLDRIPEPVSEIEIRVVNPAKPAKPADPASRKKIE